jgi:4-hydroxyphenylacetate decarboxylase small subunit
METLVYRDALNYAPIDVRKGIDLITKEIVSADAPTPKGYEPMPKCKICKNYEPEDDYIGSCLASTHYPKFTAYGDMNAKTCGMYAAP